MKFIHIADVHLGVRPDAGRAYSAKRESEIWDSFRRVIGLCEEEQTELLLIAGDLFHRQPLLRELKEVDYLFRTLTKTQVVLVAGNHDYIKKDSYYRTFTWSSNVHMILSRDISYVEIKELDTAVYGLSYYTKEMEEPLYEQIRLKDDRRFRILLAHGGDERHLPFRRTVVDKIGFDYAALGHIHKPQELIPNRMAYAGALEPTDKNDTGKHGFIKGTLDENGCSTVFVLSASREYIHMEVEVEEDMTGFGLRSLLEQEIRALGMQNMYKVTLKGFKDPEVQFDLNNMDTFGNVLEIVDDTRPAFDFLRLLAANRNNLLGKYIEGFGDAEPDSIEYEALCAGVQALLETKRG